VFCERNERRPQQGFEVKVQEQDKKKRVVDRKLWAYSDSCKCVLAGTNSTTCRDRANYSSEIDQNLMRTAEKQRMRCLGKSPLKWRKSGFNIFQEDMRPNDLTRVERQWQPSPIYPGAEEFNDLAPERT
jgi:hypothetical protein